MRVFFFGRFSVFFCANVREKVGPEKKPEPKIEKKEKKSKLNLNDRFREKKMPPEARADATGKAARMLHLKSLKASFRTCTCPRSHYIAGVCPKLAFLAQWRALSVRELDGALLPSIRGEAPLQVPACRTDAAGAAESGESDERDESDESLPTRGRKCTCEPFHYRTLAVCPARGSLSSGRRTLEASRCRTDDYTMRPKGVPYGITMQAAELAIELATGEKDVNAVLARLLCAPRAAHALETYATLMTEDRTMRTQRLGHGSSQNTSPSIPIGMPVTWPKQGGTPASKPKAYYYVSTAEGEDVGVRELRGVGEPGPPVTMERKHLRVDARAAGAKGNDPDILAHYTPGALVPSPVPGPVPGESGNSEVVAHYWAQSALARKWVKATNGQFSFNYDKRIMPNDLPYMCGVLTDATQTNFRAVRLLIVSPNATQVNGKQGPAGPSFVVRTLAQLGEEFERTGVGAVFKEGDGGRAVVFDTEGNPLGMFISQSKFKCTYTPFARWIPELPGGANAVASDATFQPRLFHTARDEITVDVALALLSTPDADEVLRSGRVGRMLHLAHSRVYSPPLRVNEPTTTRADPRSASRSASRSAESARAEPDTTPRGASARAARDSAIIAGWRACFAIAKMFAEVNTTLITGSTQHEPSAHKAYTELGASIRSLRVGTNVTFQVGDKPGVRSVWRAHDDVLREIERQYDAKMREQRSSGSWATGTGTTVQEEVTKKARALLDACQLELDAFKATFDANVPDNPGGPSGSSGPSGPSGSSGSSGSGPSFDIVRAVGAEAGDAAVRTMQSVMASDPGPDPDPDDGQGGQGGAMAKAFPEHEWRQGSDSEFASLWELIRLDTLGPLNHDPGDLGASALSLSFGAPSRGDRLRLRAFLSMIALLVARNRSIAGDRVRERLALSRLARYEARIDGIIQKLNENLALSKALKDEMVEIENDFRIEGLRRTSGEVDETGAYRAIFMRLKHIEAYARAEHELRELTDQSETTRLPVPPYLASDIALGKTRAAIGLLVLGSGASELSSGESSESSEGAGFWADVINNHTGAETGAGAGASAGFGGGRGGHRRTTNPRRPPAVIALAALSAVIEGNARAARAARRALIGGTEAHKTMLSALDSHRVDRPDGPDGQQDPPDGAETLLAGIRAGCSRRFV